MHPMRRRFAFWPEIFAVVRKWMAYVGNPTLPMCVVRPSGRFVPRPNLWVNRLIKGGEASVASRLNRGLRMSFPLGNGQRYVPFTYMPNKEQQMLWNAALKEIGRGLKYELEPEKDSPGRPRKLIAQLEAQAPPKDK